MDVLNAAGSTRHKLNFIKLSANPTIHSVLPTERTFCLALQLKTRQAYFVESQPRLHRPSDRSRRPSDSEVVSYTQLINFSTRLKSNLRAEFAFLKYQILPTNLLLREAVIIKRGPRTSRKKLKKQVYFSDVFYKTNF